MPAPTTWGASIADAPPEVDYTDVMTSREGLLEWLRLVDDLGETVEGPDAVGTLWVKGPIVIKGYLNRPEATAEAFERNFSIPYQSFNDKDGGVLLDMTQYVPPTAVPTTIVLDREGRVAARILGLADRGTLKALIEDAL